MEVLELDMDVVDFIDEDCCDWQIGLVSERVYVLA
jgi:hypothetical protein